MQLVSWIAKQTGKISDHFNDYKFYVKQQPQVIESSSTVNIQTFDSRDMTATIPCSFRWFTVRNGLTTEIHHFKGNTYICDPADVGCLLQVEITSSDPECTGTAVMTYGPVKFDILLKKEIQMALSTGESAFVVDIGQKNSSRECHLRVEEQRITFHHIPSETAFMFDYNLIQPKVQVVSKIPTRVRMIFNPKYYDDLQRFLSRMFNRQVTHEQIAHSPFLEISMNNRKARDSFVFIVKAFNTKKYLKTTIYVSNLEKQLDFTRISEKDENKTIDYLEHISQLNYDIGKLLQINGKNYVEKRLYLEESKRLQNQIEEIVGTYVKIIEEKFQGREGFQKSFVVLKQKQQEIKMQKQQKYQKGVGQLEQKFALLQQQNFTLKQKLELIQNGSVSLSNSDMNSPFKRKKIIDSASPSSGTLIQTPSFETVLRQEEKADLNKELQELAIKYQTAMREVEEMKAERVKFLSSQNRNYDQLNLDAFDAKSVKSMNNHNFQRSPSHASSSLLISNHSYAINPERLKFSSESPLKPLSPQSSLESYPIISCLQQENIALKHQLAELQHKLSSQVQQHAQKQQKYKKRISDLTEELEMYKRSNDVLNRSQHLSIEMEDYNQTQNKALKQENSFLKKEIDASQALCLKYKTELKKYKNLDKSVGEKSLVLSEEYIKSSKTYTVQQEITMRKLT